MAEVRNPILPGFNPDPCLCYAKGMWYIATSTFEWVPGVQIHVSTDLIHWKLAAHPLQNLDLRGDRDSGGVWAPCLSYADGLFWLVYTDVKMFSQTFYDVKNYIVCAKDPLGPWSEPVFVNGSGFDPSLFHDDDGKKYFVNMLFDYRTWKVRFAGIVLQEYDAKTKQLVGEAKNICVGSTARMPEGPHLYKRDGWYYLFCAEGGTEKEHRETVWRSRSVWGPYEYSPFNPLITSLPYPQNPLQKTGHASIACDEKNNWYLAHLCGRPVGPYRRCILGRETALQPLTWQEGWPCLAQKDNEPRLAFEVNDRPQEDAPRAWREDFNGSTWREDFQSLRCPLGERASLTARKGWLRLYGAQSLESCFEQSLLACRQQDFEAVVETRLDFQPKSYQQTAGLVYYYDTLSHYYACITRDERKGRVLTLMTEVLYQFAMPLGVGIPLPDTGDVWLRLELHTETARFSYSLDGREWTPLGDALDATVLSDEYYHEIGQNRFTGAFVGICCQDISGQAQAADFDYFSYQALSKEGE